MGQLFRVESISQLHEMIGYEKPRHPLISLIEMSKVPVMPVIDHRLALGFYSISLKDGDECRIKLISTKYATSSQKKPRLY